MENFLENYQEDQIKKPQAIGDLMARYFDEKKEAPKLSEDKAKHERAYWIEKTRKALGIHWKTKKEYTFGQVNGLTRKWSVYQIRDRFLYVEKNADIFGKVWFGMIKQEKAKAAEQKQMQHA